MEIVFALLLVFGVLFLVFGVPIIAFVRAAEAKRLAKQQEEKFPELIGRVYFLEQQVKKLPELAARIKVVESRTEQPEQRFQGAPGVEPPAARHEVPTPETHPAAQPPVPLRVAEVPTTPPFENAGALPKIPAAPPPVSAAAKPTPSPVPPPPRFAAQPPAPGAPVAAPVVAKASFLSNLEEALGTNWLNKLGVVVLVIGVAFFLAYELQTMGHAGKIMVGYFTAAALLSAGVIIERRENWRIIARAGIGGGWALMFFTTYAMRFIEASRIEGLSASADLVLLLLLAAGMVAHTLRYQSQVVTGLAFLLAFSTVNIGHGGGGGLWAGAILAAGLVAVAVQRQWFEL